MEVTHGPGNVTGAHLVYARLSAGIAVRGAVAIPFDERLYDPHTVGAATVRDGYPVWGRHDAPSEGWDVIAATFRLLTLADEQQIDPAARDGLGNFLVGALPAERAAMVDEPLADNHAALLLDKLIKIQPDLREAREPRWPEGKRYAVCVTHDSDAMHRGHPRELATALTKWLVRRQRVFLDMALEGLKYRHAPMANPSWGFDGWRDDEARHGFRSCFYLAVRPLGCRRRLNDCKSDALVAGIDWSVFQQMRGEGWEFGLHPALDAQRDLDEIVREKRALEERLGAPLTGIRHHYLAIDNHHPWETFRKHLAAGFRYDSSLGWHDQPGFRAGTALPFRPFDPDAEEALDLIELPLAVMDCQVALGSVGTAEAQATLLADKVRQGAGVLVLNWHTETYCNRLLYAGYRTLYERILAPLLADGDAWFATPNEIAGWWRGRAERLRVH